MTHVQIACAKTKNATFNIFQWSEGREFKSFPVRSIRDKVKKYSVEYQEESFAVWSDHD